MTVSRVDGAILSLNEPMRNLFVGAAEGDGELGSVDDCFGLGDGNALSSVFGRMGRADGWHGEVAPRGGRHGITSVEVTLQPDAADPDVVWLVSMEHPTVEGRPRFSTRSELRLLDVLLENTLEYIYFRDLEGRLILTNAAFRGQVSPNGGTGEIGRRLERFVSEASAAWLGEIDREVLETGAPAVNRVNAFAFVDGPEQWLQVTTVPVRNDEDRLVGLLSVARDISDLKRTEGELREAMTAAETASRAKSDFLAAMSHEIRTPINGIIGAAELCRETELDPEQRSYVDTVEQCGNTLLGLVNDVLDFSKIEAGQLHLERLTFSVADVLEQIVDEFAQMARRKGIELLMDYDESLPRYVTGDPARLKQIVYNLVGNAVKFTNRGEVVIGARLEALEGGQAQVEIHVRDSGVGISRDRHEEIFKSFTQADMSTTRRYGGTGLGLAICRELVGLMRGTIDVESEPQRGATFRVRLPLPIQDASGQEAIPYLPQLANKRVLVVDDNETNRRIYLDLCANWGFDAEAASDGNDAIGRMEDAADREHPYDLVLLDQQMPGITGIDVLNLMASRPALRDIRAILLSSSLNRDEIERADELGVSRALAKPVKRTTLLEVVMETFGVGGRVADPGAEGSAGRSAAETPQSSLRVLLAEDNEVNQRIAMKRLERLGHVVTVASDGADAVALARDRNFDLILLDIQMPEMDGFEVCARIREDASARGREHAYIAAMTAHALKGDRERCLQQGMDDYLAKPFRAETLRAVCDRCREAVETRRRDDGEAAESMSLQAYLDSLGPEDREDALEAAEVTLQSFPEDLLELQRALEEGDLERLQFSVHAFKGVAGLFNARRVVRFAEETESACQAGEAERALELGRGFVGAVGRMRAELEAALKRRASGR